MARLFKTPVTVEGAISTNNVISSTQSSGDEGGQIDLTKAATNTTLTTGVTIDVFQNKLRLFETGNTNRGYYIDISGGAASAGTNLVGGGSGTVTSITAGTTGLTGGTITSSGTIDIDTTKVPRLLTNTNTFAASSGATTLVVKQGATQSTTNLFEIQNTSASALAIITSGGSIFSGANGGFGATAALSTARLSVSAAASSIGIIVRGNATTPGNLQEWQDSTPTTVASVSATGAFTGVSFNSITGLSSTTPAALGTAAVGTATTAARADHVHATTGLGLTASGLNQFAATTSAQLAGVISDETGSGALVFATSPTLTTPSIGAATGTSLTTTGSVTTGAALNLNFGSPTIASSNASTASIFTTTVTGVTIGSSTIKTTAFPAETVAATSATTAGYIGIPQNSKSGAYTLVAGDAGEHIYYTVTGQTVTIPNNTTVAFQIGTTITFITAPSVSLSIAITTDTMYLAGPGTTGTRTLAAYGMATAVKTTATTWLISGNGLT
jgi:hypothetical protein